MIKREKMACDTYSLLTISSPRSLSWIVGLSTFFFQMALCMLIAANQFHQGTNSSLFNVPFKVDLIVSIAQFMSIFFCIFIQADALTSIETLTLLWRTTEWERVIPDDTDHAGWNVQVLIPNLCKLTQGILVLFVSFVAIGQSDNIIHLLKDFSALMVLSELDNLVFFLAKSGYMGKHLKLKTALVE